MCSLVASTLPPRGRHRSFATHSCQPRGWYPSSSPALNPTLPRAEPVWAAAPLVLVGALTVSSWVGLLAWWWPRRPWGCAGLLVRSLVRAGATTLGPCWGACGVLQVAVLATRDCWVLVGRQRCCFSWFGRCPGRPRSAWCRCGLLTLVKVTG